MASWTAQVLVRPEALQWIRHPAGIDGAAKRDHTLKKENVGKAAITLYMSLLYQTLHKKLKICPKTCKYEKEDKCHCLIHLKEMQHRHSKLRATLVTVYY